MHWTAQSFDLTSHRGVKIELSQNDRPMAFDCFANHLVTSAPFRKFFIHTLGELPFRAYRWETPPVTSKTMDRQFEFVVIDDSYLDRPASTHAFDDHLRTVPAASAVSFANLGGDAILVVPTLDSAASDFCHLGDFTRNASTEQQHKFWQMVGQTFMKRVGPRPVWLSTAGDGVPWLHVRLDDYPKYYAFAAYRNEQPVA